jgi:lipopolysaccharide transport system permease protein
MNNKNNQSFPKERVISAKKGLVAINFSELWNYRELFWFLAWRDILVRYKQTVIGIAWALIRPIVTMIIFTIIFGKLAKFPSDGIPYPLLSFTALLPWQFFSNALTESSNSVVANSNMISKIYFPRLVIPAAAVISGVVEFLLCFFILIALMFWYGVTPTWSIVWLPLFFLLALISAFGIGLWFSALNVEYRDVRHIVPFIVQFGLYISPVGFSSSVVPDKWRLLYSLNPMVSVIDGFRWTLLGGKTPLFVPGLLISSFIVFGILVTGLYYFRKMERTFADII